MTSGRLTLFDSPLFLGFDHLEETFDRLRKSTSGGYPPYNIEQISETELLITLAVAGFRSEDLDVELEQTQLTIRGKQTEDHDRVYLHRGIASRQFQRAFVLAEGMEIIGAYLESGLLCIRLQQVKPERLIQKIPIHDLERDSTGPEDIDVQPSDKEQ